MPHVYLAPGVQTLSRTVFEESAAVGSATTPAQDNAVSIRVIKLTSLGSHTNSSVEATFDFVERVVRLVALDDSFDKVEYCFEKVKRCFDIVAYVDAARVVGILMSPHVSVKATDQSQRLLFYFI